LSNWQGKIKSIDTPHGGDTASVTIEAKFWDFVIGFETSRTTKLKRDTNVYRNLLKIPEGSTVIFSAEVISTDNEKGIKEISWTEKGSLRAPVYIVSFTDFQAYK